ncbi:hypothetical protein VUR80DRAFT_516 [Thermomyces stellatus]
MDAFLHSAADVSCADRLKMARALALADVPTGLRTLHLGVEFSKGAFRPVEDVRLARSAAAEDEMLYCGIRNLPLHCLGVARL